MTVPSQALVPNGDNFLIAALLHFLHQTTNNCGSSHPVCCHCIILPFEMQNSKQKEMCSILFPWVCVCSLGSEECLLAKSSVLFQTTLRDMSYHTQNAFWHLEVTWLEQYIANSWIRSYQPFSFANCCPKGIKPWMLPLHVSFKKIILVVLYSRDWEAFSGKN